MCNLFNIRYHAPLRRCRAAVYFYGKTNMRIKLDDDAAAAAIATAAYTFAPRRGAGQGVREYWEQLLAWHVGAFINL